MIFGVVYMIWNKINGMKYVGQTTKPLKVRFNEHVRRKKYFIGNAIRKYGKENFYCGVIKSCSTREELNYWEKFFIAALRCEAPNGYNMTSGGENNILNEEGRLKISLSKRGEKNPNYGKHLSPETRLKMSIAQRGEKNHFFGKRHTEKTIAKMSAAKIGKHHTNETRSKLSAIFRGKSPFKNLTAELDANNFSYALIAKLMDMSFSCFSRRMCGHVKFTTKEMEKLSEIFDKPIEYLFLRDDG